jgi:hypothetical protein
MMVEGKKIPSIIWNEEIMVGLGMSLKEKVTVKDNMRYCGGKEVKI